MAAKEAKPYVYNPNPPPLPLWKYVVAGGSAGVIEIMCMYPLDVAKTRLQLQPTGKAAEGVVQYTGLIDAFSKIIKNEGSLIPPFLPLFPLHFSSKYFLFIYFYLFPSF